MRQPVLNRKWSTLSPAEKVVAVFGSREAAALAMGVTVDGLKRMLRPKALKGGGGLVPAHRQARTLKKSRELGYRLTEADFIAEPR